MSEPPEAFERAPLQQAPLQQAPLQQAPLQQAPLQQALPRGMYVEDSSWVIERDLVLATEWTCLGRRDDLGLAQPQRATVVEVLGESVILTCDTDRALHAAFNVCRHRGAQLMPAEPGSEPRSCAAGSLRCPYHSWTYRLDGGLLRAPHTEEVDRTRFSLHPVAVDEWQGFVFVRLAAPDQPGVGPADVPEQAPGGQSPAASSLDAAVARPSRTLANYRIGTLVTGASYRYEVAANWKVIAENYNECYHCGPVHPELTRLVPAFGGGGVGIDWDSGVPHREGAWTFTMSGTTVRSPLPGLDEAERVRHKGELVYPNLLLSCSADHVTAFVLRPIAVDRTRIDCLLLFAPDEVARAEFDPSDAGDFWDLVNKQDWAICESVQRGMSSRSYRHGWFAPMEDDSADIRRWLLPRMARAGQVIDG
ncbi:MAG: aromatic ring-hydroxylating oxygenase subunit alpha [Nocardioides sp.]